MNTTRDIQHQLDTMAMDWDITDIVAIIDFDPYMNNDNRIAVFCTITDTNDEKVLYLTK